MENHNSTNLSRQNKSPLILFFLGFLPILSGILDILISLNIIKYIDTRPSRIATSNDPHTWEVFTLGTTLPFFGIGNLLPAKAKFLANLNTYLLLVSFSAVMVGVILQKIK